MITRIEIENFRSIIRGRAVVTEGINFIHGPNGAGKTSILEAIAIALYGSDWVRGKYRLGDLVRRSASSAIIRLEYVGIDGHRYVVQRHLVRRRVSSPRHMSWMKVAGGSRLGIGRSRSSWLGPRV
ncbi:AAA family ATPase [Vulcanisaeta sp. JCM 14467]|uniref:AAA family ATPase n=1 Tax=Vulcanisaeta sp. JCM 14467 TaxID=1295370 RepID=UPI000A6FEB34|nr:AAA family ATPase [Vulcanisaeta sp. JCM 14467]